MSLLYGILYPKEREVEQVNLDTLYTGISNFPHVKHKQLLSENYGTGHLLTINTPEALFENQPIEVNERQLVFTFQGRIDNREDLAALLSVKMDGNVADGEIALKAYLQWKEKTPTYLRGDWSFAAYDKKDNELFLARDHHGYTAIYYYHTTELFAFSSSQKSLFGIEGFKKEPNIENIIRNLILFIEPGYNEQAIKNIFLLPPAHWLKVKNNAIELKRYWFPEQIEERLFSRKTDYAGELRQIFTTAVEKRLRSYKPVASMLSGGLDSSSVSVIAAKILASKQQKLRTYSHVPLFTNELKEAYPLSNRILDETENIKSIVNFSGNIDPIFLNSANISPLEGIEKMLEILDRPIHAASNAFWLYDIFKTTAADDYGVLLSGEQGNATISFTGVEYLLPLIDRIAFSKGFMGPIKEILKTIILPSFAYKAYIQNKPGNLQDYANNSYLNNTIKQESVLFKRIKTEKKQFNPYFKKKKYSVLNIFRPGSNSRCDWGADMGNYFGIEARDPTADIDLVEYCLTIPNQAFFTNNGTNRLVLKEMMKGLLPDEVLYAKRKGLQGSDIYFRVNENINAINKLVNDLIKEKHLLNTIDVERLVENLESRMKKGNNGLNEMNLILKTLMPALFINQP